MIRGRKISVYYETHTSAAWARHERNEIEIAVFFDLAVCHLSWGALGSEWREREMRGRQVCIIPAGQSHECRVEGRAELLVLYVDATISRLAPEGKVSEVLIGIGAQYEPEVWILATLLRRMCTAQICPAAQTVDAMGSELARRLIAGSSTRPLTLPQCRCLSHREKEKVMQYLQSNIKHDIHVIDMARQCGHSVAHFTELFINTTGKSPYRYLKDLRVVRGYEMLLTGDYLVREVAPAVGYSNSDHFGEVFRLFCGYTPRELLRRVRSGLMSAPVNPVNHRGNGIPDEI